MKKDNKVWLFEKTFLPLHSGSESVNPAMFSEAEQSKVRHSIAKFLFLLFKKSKTMKKDIILQAIEAYFKVCKNCTPVFNKDGQKLSGLIYQQPDVSGCTVGRKYVYLRNCNGEIARYNIKTEEITV